MAATSSASEKINELVNKIPITLLLFGYLGYLYLDYYKFTTDETSPLIQKQREIETTKANNVKLKGKVKEMNTFIQSLEAKKAEVRNLALELQQMKSSISDRNDVPGFIKLATTEAKKVGLSVLSVQPAGSTEKEYYAEQAYKLDFRGAYVQLLAFLDRISNVTEVVRIDNFAMKPIGSPYAKFIELQGTVEMKTYRYLGSKADKIGSQEAGGDSTLKTPAPPKGGT